MGDASTTRGHETPFDATESASAIGRTYLDHASTAPLSPTALEAMIGVLRGPVGDPSRTHQEGLTARHVVEVAREQVAQLFGARPREVVFCSGATESIAMALFGTRTRGNHWVHAGIEHSAVTAGVERATGWANGTATSIGADSSGRVDLDEFISAIDPTTALATLQIANHEVGTIQPVSAAFSAAAERGALFHTDAAIGAGRVPLRFSDTADLMSISGHKLGAPTGTGALLIRRGLRIETLLLGGDQERARRGGIENVAAIAGFGARCEELVGSLAGEAAHSRALTDRVIQFAQTTDGIEILGDPIDRVPHLVCLAVAGVEPQAVLLGLDAAGLAVHSGNSCSSESLEPSPVLAAMGVDAHRSLRVSVGPSTTDTDIDSFISTLPRVVDPLRALGSR